MLSLSSLAVWRWFTWICCVAVDTRGGISGEANGEREFRDDHFSLEILQEMKTIQEDIWPLAFAYVLTAERVNRNSTILIATNHSAICALHSEQNSLQRTQLTAVWKINKQSLAFSSREERCRTVYDLHNASLSNLSSQYDSAEAFPWNNNRTLESKIFHLICNLEHSVSANKTKAVFLILIISRNFKRIL